MRLPNQSSGVRRIVFATSVYIARINWIGSAYGQIVPAQLPVCNTGNYIGCGQEPNSTCPGQCEQECEAVDFAGGTYTECCPLEKCHQQPSGDCCKQVCCEAKVV